MKKGEAINKGIQPGQNGNSKHFGIQPGGERGFQPAKGSQQVPKPSNMRPPSQKPPKD